MTYAPNIRHTSVIAKLLSEIRRKARAVILNRQRGTGADSAQSAYGVTLASNWSDRTFRYYIYGSYGRFLADYLAARDAAFCFLDVGANQGLYSLLAARNPLCTRAYAFEPVPQTADLLARNIALNGLDDRCEVVRKAVSDRDGTVPIHIKSNHSGVASLDHDVAATGESIEIETVSGARLDEIVQCATVPIIIKVDVEGHEETAIEQLLKSSLAERIAAIFFECDERWTDPATLRAMLKAAGLEGYEIIGRGDHYDVLAYRI